MLNIKNTNNFFQIRALSFIFVIFSIIGWLYESALFFTRHLPFENRGFLTGPYLPIYGFGGLIVVWICLRLLKGDFHYKDVSLKPVVIFLVMIVVSTGLELVVGYLLDYVWGLRLWDYRNRMYNLGGYICPGASVRFGLGGVAIYYLIFPLFSRLFHQKFRRVLTSFNTLMLTVMICDLSYCLYRIVAK